MGETVKRWDAICSYFRTMMKEICRGGGEGRGWDVSPPQDISAVLVAAQQPTWVTDNKVLDSILSFESFQRQTGALREVCRQFKDSAMRQQSPLRNTSCMIR
jgi:hypothetical protein